MKIRELVKLNDIFQPGVHLPRNPLETFTRHEIPEQNSESNPENLFIFLQNTDVKIRRYTRRGDLFIILYSIVDRSSFDEARSIAKYIKDHRNIEALSMVIVATKKDLDHLRRVDIEEGIGFSNELECTFYEVSISEGYIEVQELLKELLKRVLSQKNDRKDTLRIPSISLKRSPSLERRKWGVGMFEKPKSNSERSEEDSSTNGRNPENKSPELMRRRKDSNNNIPEQLKSLRELNNSATPEETTTKYKFLSKSNSPVSQRKKNPFSIEKVKGASSANKLKIEDENKTNQKPKMFALQRARSGSGNTELGKSTGISPTESSDTYAENHDNNDVIERTSNDKPKGPFLLNKLHSTSTDKLRSSSSHERLRATTSFGRMRSGFERTFGRKKAIYL